MWAALHVHFQSLLLLLTPYSWWKSCEPLLEMFIEPRVSCLVSLYIAQVFSPTVSCCFPSCSNIIVSCSQESRCLLLFSRYTIHQGSCIRHCHYACTTITSWRKRQAYFPKSSRTHVNKQIPNQAEGRDVSITTWDTVPLTLFLKRMFWQEKKTINGCCCCCC